MFECIYHILQLKFINEMDGDTNDRYTCNIRNHTDQHVYSDLKSADDAEANDIYTEVDNEVNTGKCISTNHDVVANICKDSMKSRFKPNICFFILAIFLSTVVSSGLTYTIMFLLGRKEANSTTGDRHVNPSRNTINLNEIDINSFPRFRIYSSECPQDWYRYEDSCYKEFTEKKTWLKALDFCRSMDSDLLSIRDKNEANVILNRYLLSGVRYWIGLSDLEKNDRFEWSDRTDFNYENWKYGEPNHYNGLEDCVELRSSGTWNDANCFVSRNFVCKMQISTQCGEGSWLLHNKSCYMFNPVSNMSALSWTGARQYCKAHGADLAVTKSSNELSALLSQAFKYSRSGKWIGLNNIEQGGEYRWVDGTVLGDLPWNRGQPNNEENGCAAINEYGNADEEDCDTKRGYICEKID